MPLSADDIKKAFATLSADLASRDERAQIAITGGAALVLLFNARETTKDVEGEVVYDSAALIVQAVAIEQLLAMKLAAWRDAIDRSDAGLLLSKISGSAKEIWSRVEPFVPRSYLDKASYAFDDLWDSIHGTPDSD